MTDTIVASDSPILRAMTYIDVRKAMHGVEKRYPMSYKLFTAKHYCIAYHVSYNEELCVEVITTILDLEPGDRYDAFYTGEIER